MIVQLRLDERLIHGQITTAWSKFLTVNAIVVANDKLFSNDLAKKTLMMSAPAGIKVTVRTVQGTIDLLSDPRSEKMRVLIIVDNPKDALTLAEELDIKEVNCGNYVKKKSENKVEIAPTLRADPEDLEIFRQLASTNRHVFCQLIPTYAATELSDNLNKLGEK
jgi:mannose/fructose/N-acetylgalactosamine-specific phosphotransferase system component IIB